MSGSGSTWRTRAIVVGVLLVFGLGIWLWMSSRQARDADKPKSETSTSKHADPFERVTGGAADPDFDPAELVLSMRGRVIDLDRRPVPNADVELLAKPGARVATYASKPIKTDSNGEFVFPKLRAGLYHVEARTADAVSATVEVQLSERTAPVTLIVVPAAAMNVRVVSALDDHPIAGALVRVAPGNMDLGPVDVYREGRTDNAGVARITGLNPTSNHGAYAEAPGFAPAALNVIAGGNPDRTAWAATIRLKPGGVVTGRVVDKAGRPIAGASMRWYTGEAAKDADQAGQFVSSRQGINRLGIVRTDRDGRFRIGAEAGAGLLEAAHPTFLVGFARGVVPNGGELTLDIVLDTGAKLAGVVLDASNNPVPGAEVIVTKPGISHQQMFMDMYRFRATTDRYGEFAFSGLERDTFSLAAWNRESASELVDVDLREDAEQTGIVLELTRTGTITGTVIDSAGQPVANAQVGFFIAAQTATAPAGLSLDKYIPSLQANPRAQGVTIAGEDGRFSIGGLGDGEYEVMARRPNALSVAPVFGETQIGKVRPGSDITLKLRALGSISGRVVGENGAPVQGVSVAIAGWQGATTSYPPGRTTEPDGHFSIPEVPEGKYGLKFTGASVIDSSSKTGVEVVGSKNTDVGTIRVASGIGRKGIVVDANGAPFETATVVMQLGSDRTFEDVTDDHGRFDVPVVAPGTVIRARAYTQEVAAEWISFGTDVATPRIVLKPSGTGSISGLLIHDGQPLEKRMMMLTLETSRVGSAVVNPNDEKSRGEAMTEAGGRFLFKNVPIGQYRLWVRRAGDEGPEWIAHAEPVVVQPSKEATVVVQVAQ